MLLLLLLTAKLRRSRRDVTVWRDRGECALVLVRCRLAERVELGDGCGRLLVLLLGRGWLLVGVLLTRSILLVLVLLVVRRHLLLLLWRQAERVPLRWSGRAQYTRRGWGLGAALLSLISRGDGSRRRALVDRRTRGVSGRV